MGVLNITPDSFYDGGKFNKINTALKQVEKLINDGADFIDIGAESSRPHAKKISIQEEQDRLLPILEKINENFDIKISVDTYNPETMEQSLKLGCNLINDISGLANLKSYEIIKKYNAKICIMHMQGNPRNMQKDPKYKNIVAEIYKFFEDKINTCIDYGIDKNNIILDPGFGFGKNLEHNIEILKNLKEFKNLNLPILVGLSRKSMIEHALGPVTPDKRIGASLALAIAAMKNGANIIRCHDVFETRQALAAWLRFNGIIGDLSLYN